MTELVRHCCSVTSKGLGKAGNNRSSCGFSLKMCSIQTKIYAKFIVATDRFFYESHYRFPYLWPLNSMDTNTWPSIQVSRANRQANHFFLQKHNIGSFNLVHFLFRGHNFWFWHFKSQQLSWIRNCNAEDSSDVLLYRFAKAAFCKKNFATKHFQNRMKIFWRLMSSSHANVAHISPFLSSKGIWSLVTPSVTICNEQMSEKYRNRLGLLMEGPVANLDIYPSRSYLVLTITEALLLLRLYAFFHRDQWNAI